LLNSGPLSTGFLAGSFFSSAAAFPERNALHVEGRYYTYAELNTMVSAIVRKFNPGGIPSRIGIYGGHNVYTYASMIAVNALGAAYVPLNPKFPAARIAEVIMAADLHCVICTEADLPVVIQSDLVLVNPRNADIVPALNEKGNDETLAYILFTSGSSGVPKGVPVSEKNVKAFFSWFRDNYDFTENDRFLQVYELSFDVSVFSFFMPLSCGACCYVLPDEGIRPLKIIEAVQKSSITVLSMVPSVLGFLSKYLKQISLPSLRYSFFSGDALMHDLAESWQNCLPNGRIHNFYGPTETTIVCTRHIFNASVKAADIVPLGKPFDGMSYHIMKTGEGQEGRGELCLSGAQVISRYLDNKYADRFFVREGKTYYRTGDLVSVNENGELLFHGRVDNQVKINGYRVELEELEAASSRVSNSRCMASFDKQKQALELYVESTIKDATLLQKLSLVLPAYMLPQRIIYVDALPFTLNGKPDRKALLNMYI
jgi:amino acid adenylation domain-containing protein